MALLFKGRFPNSKALVLLLLNVVFMGFFIVTGQFSEHFIQAYFVGGFFLIPFQIIALLVATLLRYKVSKLKELNNINCAK